VSPLEVHFSQHVISPLFSDGRSVDDSSREIEAVEKEDVYELKAPFPGIQAVRWCPKLRDGEGKPSLDENGEERRGLEGLFTLDNRRLYALQRAAVALYPRTCKISVEVITNRWEVAQHVKKFRTRTNGLSIFIAEWNGTGRNNTRHSEVLRVWDWRSAVTKLEEGGTEVAAENGSCGCWEYLDPKSVCRGPFSNWQMQQWWEHKMLPPDLQIRPFERKGGETEQQFRPVWEVFADAPKAFAPGWMPSAANAEIEFHTCAECFRQRTEGWSARGKWYCSNCWRKWRSS